MTDITEYYPEYDLKFVTGDYVFRRMLFEDPASEDPDDTTKVPRNWAGWSARAQIRASAKRDAEVVATCEVTLGQDNIADGYLLLEIMPEESAKCVRRGVWDLELTDPDGRPTTVLGGKSLPKPDVTR
jgi:hypothetical protein